MRETSLTELEGIGPGKALLLKDEAGLETIEDLLYYAPRRYLDRSTVKKIKDCFVNETVSIIGTISSVRLMGGKKKFLQVTISDDTDSLQGIFFGGIKYFQKIFIPGEDIIFSGKITFRGDRQIVHPDFDFIEETSRLKTINTAGIIPLYRSTERLRGAGLDSRGFRRLMRQVLDRYLPRLSDSLPESLRERCRLMPLGEALFSLHFPSSFALIERARKRLAFNELFFLFFYIHYTKKTEETTVEGISITDKKELLQKFIQGLPFALTPDQEENLQKIVNDLKGPFPMNRLLQGDVGSGKTVVALAAAVTAASSGYQSALMAPTAVLAAQHFQTITGLAGESISTALLTGQTPASERNKILNYLEEGNLDLICGTHALFQDDVRFARAGLFIIDEQHRFGVAQRAALREKGKGAHLLVMTATPIPRSLAMTLYGDLELSAIKTMPAGRPPRKTLALPESRLRGVYNSMRKYIDQGRQVYYILPLIEESAKSDLKAAISVFEHLRDKIFNDKKISLLHGKMKQAEKDAAMESFRKGESDILVSTTVIEVGVDVPNAAVIIIHHPERFGLSQLHQLRGRVGRGIHESFCVLLYPDDIGEESLQRIRVLEKTDNGFAIAEEDLKSRGAGELTGLRQHGASEFEFTDLVNDIDIITLARKEAGGEVDTLLAERHGKNGKGAPPLREAPLVKDMRQKKILQILS